MLVLNIASKVNAVILLVEHDSDVEPRESVRMYLMASHVCRPKKKAAFF